MKKLNIESLAPKILGLLLGTLITLKLTGCITWSWWWITSPLWGGFLLSSIFMLLAGVIIYIQKIKSKFKNKHHAIISNNR